jgi:hypothetical protein
MSYAGTRSRVYEPEAMNIMGRAFEKAVRSLSEQSKKDPNTRRQLAACIMRLFDEGERAPLHLSLLALSIIQRPFSKECIAPFCTSVPLPSGTDRRREKTEVDLGWP